MNEIKKQLMEELTRLNQMLTQYEPDTEEYAAIVAQIQNLNKAILEIEESELKSIKNDEEKEDRKKERWIKIGLGAAGLALTGIQVFGDNIWRGLCMKFEETGNYSGLGSKILFQEVFRRKK